MFPPGTIPHWLKGSLYASSPGVFDLENGSVNNWFDGYAIISKFEFDGRKVSFKSKYLQSNAHAKAVEAKRPVMQEFGTPPWSNSRKLFAKLIPFVSPIYISLLFKCVCKVFRGGQNNFSKYNTLMSSILSRVWIS